MRTVYRVLAFLVALEVAVQAMFIVYGDAGLGLWVEDGGVVDKATFDNAFESGQAPFAESSPPWRCCSSSPRSSPRCPAGSSSRWRCWAWSSCR